MTRRNIHALARVLSRMAEKLEASLHRKEARAFALSWSAAILAGCSVPGPKSPKDAIRALDRVPYTDSVGTDLSALRVGDQALPRLIYVHGSPGDATAFADDLIDPVPGFESLSIDRPGFGEATGSGPVTSFEAQARAIEPLLVERNGQWPILVGHSLGGPIVARAAADFPDRVAGIVIVAGSLDPAYEEPKWFNRVAAVPPVRWILPGLLKISNEEMFAGKQETLALAQVLDRIRCPVAIVHGTNDGLVPYGNVDYMHRTLTNAESIRTFTLEGEGHFLVWKTEGRVTVREAIEHVARRAHTPAASERANDRIQER